jgi:hypothetical protein
MELGRDRVVFVAAPAVRSRLLLRRRRVDQRQQLPDFLIQRFGLRLGVLAFMR